MNKPHMFKEVTNGNSSYDWGIYCEYCGHVAFYANNTNNTDAQSNAAKGCPCAPDKEQPESLTAQR